MSRYARGGYFLSEKESSQRNLVEFVTRRRALSPPALILARHAAGQRQQRARITSRNTTANARTRRIRHDANPALTLATTSFLLLLRAGPRHQRRCAGEQRGEVYSRRQYPSYRELDRQLPSTLDLGVRFGVGSFSWLLLFLQREVTCRRQNDLLRCFSYDECIEETSERIF